MKRHYNAAKAMGVGDPDDPIERDPDSTELLPDGDATRTTGAHATSGAGAPVPATIGDYRVLAKLGEGGMGVVYEAEQQHPRRRVALKVIRGGAFVDEHRLKMFEREANTLARLKHPNIGGIYESGAQDGQHFFAMELVRGETLDRLHGRNRPSPLPRGRGRAPSRAVPQDLPTPCTTRTSGG